MSLFPPSLKATLRPGAGRPRLTPESALSSNNPRHTKYQTEVLLMFCQLLSHVTAETAQAVSPWMCYFIAFLFPLPANTHVGTTCLTPETHFCASLCWLTCTSQAHTSNLFQAKFQTSCMRK